MDSQEFRDRYGTDPQPDFLVPLLYRNAFGREPEPEGLASWTAPIQAGLSPAGLLHAIALRPEARLHIGTAADEYWYVRGGLIHSPKKPTRRRRVTQADTAVPR
ncbi:DUF4214 domain-containing protein [Skermanella pratensis]|uniref:DUF4214 domain-containing protein n=1 Tax=Skermanella pratensis TaxID=2233999 RepID=UPI003CCCF022